MGGFRIKQCRVRPSPQTRPLFLLPFPLLIRSSPHYRISSPCHHVTTGIPLELSTSLLQRPWPLPPLQNAALHLPQSVRVWTTTVIPNPVFSFTHVPVSVPPTVPRAPPAVPARSSYARVAHPSALRSLREAVLLHPARGAPRRVRWSHHGPPPLVFPPREHPRRRLHRTVPSYPSLAPSAFPMHINDSKPVSLRPLASSVSAPIG